MILLATDCLKRRCFFGYRVWARIDCRKTRGRILNLITT